MDATGMACVDEAKAKKATVGISFLISLAAPKRKQAATSCIRSQPGELDVPLDKWLARISHHPVLMSLGSGPTRMLGPCAPFGLAAFFARICDWDGSC
jgi:hypothetical protein